MSPKSSSAECLHRSCAALFREFIHGEDSAGGVRVNRRERTDDSSERIALNQGDVASQLRSLDKAPREACSCDQALCPLFGAAKLHECSCFLSSMGTSGSGRKRRRAANGARVYSFMRRASGGRSSLMNAFSVPTIHSLASWSFAKDLIGRATPSETPGMYWVPKGRFGSTSCIWSSSARMSSPNGPSRPRRKTPTVPPSAAAR
jgi:hypothetical protein